jgi:hypothetical protein
VTNAFLPTERVFIPELDVLGVVTQVKITTYGTEYLVRYFDDKTPQEAFFYDFEVRRASEQTIT